MGRSDIVSKGPSPIAFAAVALAAALAAASCSASAAPQEWKPSRNVEIVVGSGAGGAADRSARVAQRFLQALPGVPSVTVVNRAGGGGSVAYGFLAQHRGDAHFLGTMATGLLTNEIVGTSKLSYRDLTPLNILVREYVVAWAGPDSPIGSVRDLLARLRKAPASVSFGFATAAGNQNHIVIGMFARAAGVDPKALKSVIYASGGQGMMAALGGHVDVWVGTAGGALQHRRTHAIRVLGISARERQSGELADVPTFREQGIAAEHYAWRGFVAPGGIGPAQAAFWDEAFVRMIRAEEWRKGLAGNAWAEDYSGPAETRARLDAEYVQLTDRLVELGLVKR